MLTCMEKEDGVPWPGLQVINESLTCSKKLLIQEYDPYYELSLCIFSGLNRSGKSCRLRWVNYLRPGLKRGQLTPQEEGIIIELHALWGNK